MGIITRNAANNITTGGVILPAGINDASVASISELEQIATGGGLNLISSQTASSSSSIEFTSGIDSTYDIYKWEFNSIHPATDNVSFTFNLSTDGGSNYNVTKTTTFFHSYHNENGLDSGLAYQVNQDLAQSTSYQNIMVGLEAQSDNNGSGFMTLYNPASTVFVKHFIATSSFIQTSEVQQNSFMAGYGNTTSAIDAVKFQMSSGNIDAGEILLFGVN